MALYATGVIPDALSWNGLCPVHHGREELLWALTCPGRTHNIKRAYKSLIKTHFDLIKTESDQYILQKI